VDHLDPSPFYSSSFIKLAEKTQTIIERHNCGLFRKSEGRIHICLLYFYFLERTKEMGIKDLAVVGKKVGDLLVRESPSILTAMAVGGLFTTVAMAVSATPKATEEIETEKEMRKKDSLVEGYPFEPVTKWEMVKLTWKIYAPAAAMGLATAFCIVGANTISMKRYAALGGLYGLAEATLREYQEKVVKTIGERKEEALRSDILQDKLNADPLSNKTIIMTGKGKSVCYDTLSGRYFEGNIEEIRKIQNDLNVDMLNCSGYIQLNDLYYRLGLGGTKLGETLSWSLDHMLEIIFDAKVSDDGQPCIVLDYRIVKKKG